MTEFEFFKDLVDRDEKQRYVDKVRPQGESEGELIARLNRLHGIKPKSLKQIIAESEDAPY